MKWVSFFSRIDIFKRVYNVHKEAFISPKNIHLNPYFFLSPPPSHSRSSLLKKKIWIRAFFL